MVACDKLYGMPLLVPQYAVQFLLILTMGVALIVTVFQLAILVFGVEKKGYVRKVTSVVLYIFSRRSVIHADYAYAIRGSFNWK